MWRASGGRRLTVLFAVLVVVSSAYSSAALAALPVRELGSGRVATCLRSPAPDTLALLGPRNAGEFPTDVLAFGTLSGKGRLRLGRGAECAVTAAGGSRVLAAQAVRAKGNASLVRAVLTRRGRGSPVTLARVSRASVNALATAVTPRGDAVVAWTENEVLEREDDFRTRFRIRASLRRPGGRFGAPVDLTPARTADSFSSIGLSAAADGAGELAVAWSEPASARHAFGDGSVLKVAPARAAGGFRGGRVLTRLADDPSAIALAFSPDGHGILAIATNDVVRVWNRSPGGAFRAGAALGDADRSAHAPTVAIRDGGGALVAWRWDADNGDVAAAWRERRGRFDPSQTLWRAPFSSDDGTSLALGFGSGPPLDSAGGQVRAGLSGDGGMLVTWAAPRRPDGDFIHAGFSAAGTLGAGFSTPHRFGSPCRPLNGVVPVLRAGATPAIAWTDNATHSPGFEGIEIPGGHGRLHRELIDDYPLPVATPPRFTVAASPTQRLLRDDPVVLRVRCNGRCDLRGFVPSGSRMLLASGGTALRRGREATLRIRPSGFEHVAPRRPGLVPVIVRACSPDGTASSSVVVQVRLARATPPPLAVPISARAVRRGRRVVVTWQTRIPARKTTFFVSAVAPTDRFPEYDSLVAFVEGRDRRRFRTVLTIPRGVRVSRITRVTLEASLTVEDVTRTTTILVRQPRG